MNHPTTLFGLPTTTGTPATYVTHRSGHSYLDASEAMSNARLQYDGFITQILDNNLDDLEGLRAAIEQAKKKDIPDVREFAEGAHVMGSSSARSSVGAALLRGIEGKVDYVDLVNIIRDLRLGLARRRAELT